MSEPEDTGVLRRVKAYKLADDGNWEDQGTGQVSLVHNKAGRCMTIVITSETAEEKIILSHKIEPEDVYQRQGETIISWTSHATSLDLALSFQEAAGCEDLWDRIEAIQQVEDPDDLESFLEACRAVSFRLAAPELQNLDRLLTQILETSPRDREATASYLVTKKYIKTLIDLFYVCEESELSSDSLTTLFNIFKAFVQLNEACILEQLLDDDLIMGVMGIFEYDPDLHTKIKHRDFLKNTATFKQAVQISDPAILCKIHQNFRIQYIKDVVLARILDDPTITHLNSMLYFNNGDIIAYFEGNDRPLEELFLKVKSEVVSDEEYANLLMFLQELCNLAKHQNRASSESTLYKALSAHGLFELIEVSMTNKTHRVRLACADIMQAVLAQEGSLLRSFVLSEEPEYTLFKLIVARMQEDEDIGIQTQLTDIVRLLTHPETMAEYEDKDVLLGVFYDHLMDIVMKPIAALSNPTTDPIDDSELPYEDLERRNALLNNTIELLIHFVQTHGYRIKYYIIGNNVVLKVLQLLKMKDKFLVLAGIRFFRACVGLKDEFYNRHLVKYKLFAPIITLLVQTGDRYNLLNSAILELFEFIKKNNLKNLITHLVTSYSDTFAKITYVNTFKNLILRHEQNTEGLDVPSEAAEEASRTDILGPKRRPPPQQARRDFDEDEDYFSEHDDEDTAAADPAPQLSQKQLQAQDQIRQNLKRKAMDDEDQGAFRKSPRLSYTSGHTNGFSS
eukprot:gnl/Hemi2/4415_TR1546_c0_g1_i1.p1 gnl/Hemi2/4415_TR1546_c0_g1~~gnl/Hemi2/4415_TR1546_c0_g1_i1.p1  ORF type:complete len:735 (-),score=190.05 gnl/Hemi2/4415_TR1546_c0_g1_i1:113-2317(-)